MMYKNTERIKLYVPAHNYVQKGWENMDYKYIMYIITVTKNNLRKRK